MRTIKYVLIAPLVAFGFAYGGVILLVIIEQLITYMR